MRSKYIWPVAAIFILAAGLSYYWWKDSGQITPEQLAMGRTLYDQNCASCHGINLEGQQNWRQPLPNGRLPAPPHDATGHTWHHPDDVLFRITKEGTAAVAGGGYESDMPGFGDKLTDTEIRLILAYIKSTWPDKLRERQQKVSNAR